MDGRESKVTRAGRKRVGAALNSSFYIRGIVD